MVKCSDCGMMFDANDASEQAPCPQCGATSRVFDEGITLGVKLADHAMLERRRYERTIAVRESERDGRVTWADEENGYITTTVTGSSPVGETDTLHVCRTLIHKHNKLGGTWNEPVEWREPNSDIDCVATNKIGEKGTICIQVVRAIVDQEWWRTLSISESNTTSGTADDLAEVICDAVKKKADRTPVKQRATLVLAIDANRLAGLTLDSVVDTVREKHGATLAGLGFQSIWVVGPSISRTHRLDIPS